MHGILRHTVGMIDGFQISVVTIIAKCRGLKTISLSDIKHKILRFQVIRSKIIVPVFYSLIKNINLFVPNFESFLLKLLQTVLAFE